MRSLAGPAVVLVLLVSLFSAVGLTEHASAAEPDEIGAAEGRQTPSQPVSTESAKLLRDLRREFGNLGLASVR